MQKELKDLNRIFYYSNNTNLNQIAIETSHAVDNRNMRYRCSITNTTQPIGLTISSFLQRNMEHMLLLLLPRIKHLITQYQQVPLVIECLQQDTECMDYLILIIKLNLQSTMTYGFHQIPMEYLLHLLHPKILFIITLRQRELLVHLQWTI